MNDIQIIESADMMDVDVLNQITAVSESIEDGFKLRQRFRPRFLMETSVLNDMKFPTPDAKYWQCNVERDTHFRNLVMLSFDYKEKLADIELLNVDMDETGSNARDQAMRHKLCAQIGREEAQLIYMRKEATERAREILNWSDIMDDLIPQLKYPVNNPEAHMPESYAARYAHELKAMKVAGDLHASDTTGAMNILSVADSVFTHKNTTELIE